MRNVTIVESNIEPNKEHLWFYNGELKWFGPNGWEDVCVDKFPSPSPTTTTTTTTTPVPAPSTFKLINNTGDTLTVFGVSYFDGEITTSIPPVPNGGSILLLKDNRGNLGINLQSYSHFKLGIIVDGENRGELSLMDSLGSAYYVFYSDVFKDATEILVYNAST